jgi:hypothetical protein
MADLTALLRVVKQKAKRSAKQKGERRTAVKLESLVVAWVPTIAVWGLMQE